MQDDLLKEEILNKFVEDHIQNTARESDNLDNLVLKLSKKFNESATGKDDKYKVIVKNKKRITSSSKSPMTAALW